MMIKVSAIILAFSLALSGAALAQGKSKNKNKGGKKDGVEIQVPTSNDTFKLKTPGVPVINTGDIDLIRRFFNTNPDAFGGNSPKPIPPGIRKNMARGKPMPPGIQKTRFPGGLNSQLPFYPGYEWTMIGNDVAIVAEATNIIVDLFRDTF
jgi:hypothetical protein